MLPLLARYFTAVRASVVKFLSVFLYRYRDYMYIGTFICDTIFISGFENVNALEIFVYRRNEILISNLFRAAAVFY